MKMKHLCLFKKYCLLFFLPVLAIVELRGQTTTGHEILDEVQERLFRVNLMSPQAYNFTKYAGHSVSLSTGESGTKIPMYTYKDNDFEIPVSIGYNSSGFIPNQREGIIGLGWFLSAGGSITRIVNREPDDSQMVLPGVTGVHGLLHGIKNNLSVKSTNKNDIFNFNAGVVTQNWQWHVGFCETDPDLFSFNVPGLSGRFYFENNGEVRCIGSKPYKVDFSGVSIYYNSLDPEDMVSNSSFVITTDDGYKYNFGGSMQYLDIAYGINPQLQACNPIINAWHLTKITAPNGRTVLFNFKGFDPGIHQDEHPDDPSHYYLTINKVRTANRDSVGYGLGGFEYSSTTNVIDQLSATKTSYLEEILVDGRVSIKFNYEENVRAFYQAGEYLINDFNQKNLLLKKISISIPGQDPIKEFDFTQKYYGGQHSRLFLVELKETGSNPYKFTYYETANLPDPLTGAIDHWGFWNANTSNQGATIPSLTYQRNGDVTITGHQRNPNIYSCKTALLKEIIYPTKGFTRYHYEPHQYAQKLDRKNDFNFLPKLYNENGTAGGARVSKIEEYDGQNTHTVREFKYVKNYPAGSVSSGVLMQTPRYAFYWEQYIPGYVNAEHLKLRSTSSSYAYSGLENFIQYSEVTEVQPGNGYVVNKFTDYNTNPDENDYHIDTLDHDIYPTITNVHLWNSYVGIKFNDKFFERGIPYHTKLYKQNGLGEGILIKENKTLSFTGLDDFPDTYVVGVHLTGGIAQSYKRYYYPYLPKKSQEIVYNTNGGNPVITETEYVYNSFGYPLKNTVTKSDGDTLISVTAYPTDYATGTGFIDDMVDSNLLVYPIERVQYKKQGPDIHILSGMITKYNPDGQGQIESLHQLETPDPIALSSFKFSNRSQGVLPPSGTVSGFSPDNLYNIRSIVNGYDVHGNLLQYKREYSGPATSHVWDYYSRYPIAVVQNALVNEIAYTSFEADGIGNWELEDEDRNISHSITGKKSYEMVSGTSISKSGLTVGKKYLVSYWSRNGAVNVNASTGVSGPTRDGWTYWEHELPDNTTSVTLNGINKIIDELRLYPKDARMVTSTYDPLIGVTSQCDATNHISYYYYDVNGRLEIVRDQDKNIVRRLCYNFAGSPQPCIGSPIYLSESKSGNFRKNNCGVNKYGSLVTYTVAAEKYSSAVSVQAANIFAQQDVDENGQDYANEAGGCTSASECYNSDAIHWTTSAFSITVSDTTFTLNYSTEQDGETFNFSSPVRVGQIMGLCRPTANRTFTSMESGRSWTVDINTLGNVYLKLNSGTSPVESEVIHISGTFAL